MSTVEGFLRELTSEQSAAARAAQEKAKAAWDAKDRERRKAEWQARKAEERQKREELAKVRAQREAAMGIKGGAQNAENLPTDSEEHALADALRGLEIVPRAETVAPVADDGWDSEDEANELYQLQPVLSQLHLGAHRSDQAMSDSSVGAMTSSSFVGSLYSANSNSADSGNGNGGKAVTWSMDVSTSTQLSSSQHSGNSAQPMHLSSTPQISTKIGTAQPKAKSTALSEWPHRITPKVLRHVGPDDPRAEFCLVMGSEIRRIAAVSVVIAPMHETGKRVDWVLDQCERCMSCAHTRDIPWWFRRCLLRITACSSLVSTPVVFLHHTRLAV